MILFIREVARAVLIFYPPLRVRFFFCSCLGPNCPFSFGLWAVLDLGEMPVFYSCPLWAIVRERAELGFCLSLFEDMLSVFSSSESSDVTKEDVPSEG